MHRLFAQAYFYSEIQDIFDSFVAQPFSEYFDRFNFKVFRYSFSIALKVDFPCPIAVKFSPVIGYGLKFVKM